VLCVEAHGDLISHASGGHKESGFAAEDLSGIGFEAIDGRVFAVDVVADFGAGHGFAHGRSRLGDGIAAEVDDLIFGVAQVRLLPGWLCVALDSGETFRSDFDEGTPTLYLKS
jgi:hypothetical protein